MTISIQLVVGDQVHHWSVHELNAANTNESYDELDGKTIENDWGMQARDYRLRAHLQGRGDYLDEHISGIEAGDCLGFEVQIRDAGLQFAIFHPSELCPDE